MAADDSYHLQGSELVLTHPYWEQVVQGVAEFRAPRAALPTESDLRAACAKVQERHERLRAAVSVHSDPWRASYRVQRPDPDRIAVDLISGAAPRAWTRLLARRCAVEFDMAAGYMFRVSLLVEEGGARSSRESECNDEDVSAEEGRESGRGDEEVCATLVVAAHHMSCDGRGILQVLHEVLDFLAHPEKASGGPQPHEHLADRLQLNCLERLLYPLLVRALGPFSLAKDVQRIPFRPQEEVGCGEMPRLASHAVTVPGAGSLREAARAKDATLGAVFGAVAQLAVGVVAARQRRAEAGGLAPPVPAPLPSLQVAWDMRARVDPPLSAEHVGSCVDVGPLKDSSPSADDTVWTLARRIRASMLAFERHELPFASRIGASVHPDELATLVASVSPPANAVSLVGLSSVGPWGRPSRYGPLQLSSVYFANGHFVYSSAVVLLVSSFEDSLSAVVTINRSLLAEPSERLFLRLWTRLLAEPALRDVPFEDLLRIDI
jgi:hypothetical protein